jgi:nucleotide-binding universal stress UspA family protein
MHRLLVPFDGSDNAIRALRHAVALAKSAGNTSLRLLHVHEEPRIYGEIAVYVSAQKMKALQRQHSEAILAHAERLVRRSGVPHSTEVLTGPVARTIARRAQKLGCDAIVMGTKGMTALGNLVMGSTAMKVVHLSRIPVTLVR